MYKVDTLKVLLNWFKIVIPVWNTLYKSTVNVWCSDVMSTSKTGPLAWGDTCHVGTHTACPSEDTCLVGTHMASPNEDTCHVGTHGQSQWGHLSRRDTCGQSQWGHLSYRDTWPVPMRFHHHMFHCTTLQTLSSNLDIVSRSQQCQTGFTESFMFLSD